MASYPAIIGNYILDQIFGFQDANYFVSRTDSLKDAISKEHGFDSDDSSSAEHGKHADGFLTSQMIQTDSITKDKIKMTYLDVTVSVVTSSYSGIYTHEATPRIPRGIVYSEVLSTTHGTPISIVQKVVSDEIEIWYSFYGGNGGPVTTTIRCYYFAD
jgi:K+-transporting ATPase c subunit